MRDQKISVPKTRSAPCCKYFVGCRTNDANGGLPVIVTVRKATACNVEVAIEFLQVRKFLRSIATDLATSLAAWCSIQTGVFEEADDGSVVEGQP